MNIPKMTDEQIDDLAVEHLGNPGIDPTNFARAIIAARDAQVQAALAEQEPVAWAAFAENGNIRLWSVKPPDDATKPELRSQIVPLYTHPAQTNPAAQEQEPVQIVGWLEDPFGAFRANPDFKLSGPNTLRWSIPVFMKSEPSTPATQERAEPVAPAVQTEKEITDLIQQREHRDEIIDQLCDAVLGLDRAEWSSAYYFEDAVNEVNERMAWIEQRLENRDSNAILSATPPAPAQPAPYGNCPQCGARGVMRERSPNGKTTCTNGHEFPHARFDAAQPSPEPSKPEQAEAPSEIRDDVKAVLIGLDVPVIGYLSSHSQRFHKVARDVASAESAVALVRETDHRRACDRIAALIPPPTSNAKPVAPAEDDCDTVDKLLRGLGLDPERCRTEGGVLNVGRVLSLLKDGCATLPPDSAAGEREAFEIELRKHCIQKPPPQAYDLAWCMWKARAALATKPQEEQEAAGKGDELTPEDVDLLEQVVNDFCDDGETMVDHSDLMRFVSMGYLECERFMVLPGAQKAIDAARASNSGGAAS